jgi:hypothetical protein
MLLDHIHCPVLFTFFEFKNSQQILLTYLHSQKRGFVYRMQIKSGAILWCWRAMRGVGGEEIEWMVRDCVESKVM